MNHGAGEGAELAEVTSSDSARSVLVGLLRLDSRLYGPSRKHPTALDSLSLADDSWSEVSTLVSRSSLAHTLLTAENALGKLPATVAQEWHDEALNNTGQAVVVAAHVRKVAEAFAEAEIHAIFYKGVALSLLTTGRIESRGGGDIDVLVAKEDLIQAHEVLHKIGIRSAFGITPVSGKNWDVFTALYKESLYQNDLCDLDLHWRPMLSSGVTPSFQTLWGRSVTVEIGPTRIQTLSPADALAIMCAAFYVDNCQSLKQIVDIRRLSLLEGSTSASGYSAHLIHLRDAVLALVQELFEPENAPDFSWQAKRWLRRIESQWNHAGVTSNQASHTPIVSWRVHLYAAAFEWQSGNGLPNLARYFAGRFFEFRYKDFNHGRFLLWRAFLAELKFQIDNRIRYRKKRGKN